MDNVEIRNRSKMQRFSDKASVMMNKLKKRFS